MLRHLTDIHTLCQNIYVWSIYRHKARTLESIPYIDAMPDTWILSIYRHYAKTLEFISHTHAVSRHLIRSIYWYYANTLVSISHTDAMLRHLNPFHQQTLCQDTWIQSIYWQCGHSLTYRHYSKLCDSSLHTDTIVSHVAPFYTLMSSIFKECCNIRNLYMSRSSKRVYLNLIKLLCTFLIYVLLATRLHDSFFV
jgi:hypothetical protein